MIVIELKDTDPIPMPEEDDMKLETDSVTHTSNKIQISTPPTISPRKYSFLERLKILLKGTL